jgi:cell division transport system permease protein
MKRYETSYFFREGVRGIFLHGFMSFAAVGVIVACLLIMGSFALLAYNLDAMIREIEGTNEILVILDESLSPDEAKQFGTDLAKNKDLMENIQEAAFIPRDRVLENFISLYDEEDRLAFEGFRSDNPMRDQYTLLLIDVERMEETVAALEKLSGVAVVNARPDIVQQLGYLRSAVNAVSLLLIVILMAVSVFIISNTIKLATFDRREEIAIMRVVGATKSFIRWPFLIEGFLLGLLGAILAFFLQWRVYGMFTGSLARFLSGFMRLQTVSFGEILLPVLAVFLLAGFLAGMGGSVLTIRKFLRV